MGTLRLAALLLLPLLAAQDPVELRQDHPRAAASGGQSRGQAGGATAGPVRPGRSRLPASIEAPVAVDTGIGLVGLGDGAVDHHRGVASPLEGGGVADHHAGGAGAVGYGDGQGDGGHGRRSVPVGVGWATPRGRPGRAAGAGAASIGALR